MSGKAEIGGNFGPGGIAGRNVGHRRGRHVLRNDCQRPWHHRVSAAREVRDRFLWKACFSVTALLLLRG
jgi:hypothetical protein